MSKDLKTKYKRPKQNSLATTNPETSTSRIRRQDSETRLPEPVCPLIAKDSEWADILQTPNLALAQSTANVSDEEEVECEDGPQMKPLAKMFPGLLDEDPQTLQGILNKAMSTTEVTKHLVDLGQKANFTFMKKTDRLIPPGKQWLESVTETSNSLGSIDSPMLSDGVSKDDDISSRENNNSEERLCNEKNQLKRRRKKKRNILPGSTNQGSWTNTKNKLMIRNTLTEIFQWKEAYLIHH